MEKFAWNYLRTEKDVDGFLYFHRFLPEQQAVYKFNAMYDMDGQMQKDTCLRLYTTADRLQFDCRPDSNMLRIAKLLFQPLTFYQPDNKIIRREKFTPGKDKNCYAEDLPLNSFVLFVDGVWAANQKCKKGRISFSFPHPGKESVEVCLLLPNMRVGIRNIEANGNLAPIPHNKKRLLCLGDSITSGGNAKCLSNTYVMRLAQELDMEVLNQGVSGSCFHTDTLRGLENLSWTPDLITVAFGTNDWTYAPSGEEIAKRADAYLTKLRAIFPESPVAIITPIWRADEEIPAATKNLDQVRRIITEVAEKLPKVHVINGKELVPHHIGYYGDGYLHPNDAGHRIYAENLAVALMEVYHG